MVVAINCGFLGNVFGVQKSVFFRRKPRNARNDHYGPDPVQAEEDDVANQPRSWQASPVCPHSKDSQEFLQKGRDVSLPPSTLPVLLWSPDSNDVIGI